MAKIRKEYLEDYISSTTQTALNAKQNTITAGTTAQYYRGDKTFQTLDKTAVGLSNVDNTSDANKPVSTAQETAIANISWLDKMKRGIQFFTDFEGAGSATPYLLQFSSGTGATTVRSATTIPNQTSNQVGICQYQTGTIATGAAYHSGEPSVSGPKQINLGNGTWVFETSIEVEALSTATERYRFVSGFSWIGSSANAIVFYYDEGNTLGYGSSPNWQCVTSFNNVRTVTVTTVPINLLFNTLRIEVNAGGTSATFKINGVTVATHTTNIPVGLGLVNVVQGIAKTIGTTNRSVYCDYLGYENILTTPRT